MNIFMMLKGHHQVKREREISIFKKQMLWSKKMVRFETSCTFAHLPELQGEGALARDPKPQERSCSPCNPKKELTHKPQGCILRFLFPPKSKKLKLIWQCPFAQNKDFCAREVRCWNKLFHRVKESGTSQKSSFQTQLQLLDSWALKTS